MSRPSAVPLVVVPLLALLVTLGCSTDAASSSGESSADGASSGTAAQGSPLGQLVLGEEEWRARLTPMQFAVLREDDTERPFTGEHWDTKTRGTYRCAGCDLALFSSETKFASGTGWPSYWEPIATGHVATEHDSTFGWSRTEAICARCGGHLGHVFDDGPEPTGERWCINSASLVLDAGEPTSADR